MTYGRYPYGGVGYAGSDVDDIPQNQTQTILAVEVAFTTGALETPVWVDVTADVRSWDVSRGRTRELERFQPGRATVVFGNLSRQYDSVNAAGPYFGNIRPMRRIRIRETFNGVTYPIFDGFVDKWQLDYPDVGKDATATVTATDLFKVLARTELGRSVFEEAVLDDGASVYWRVDETLPQASDATLVAKNTGSLGSSANGTFMGPPDALGDEGLVVLDPGGSMRLSQETVLNELVIPMGITVDDANFNLIAGGSFVLEAWCRPDEFRSDGLVGNESYIFSLIDSTNSRMILRYVPVDRRFSFIIANDAAGVFAVAQTAETAPGKARYHVVVRFVVGQPLQLWVNGTLFTGDTPTGAYVTPTLPLNMGNANVTPGSNNFIGKLAHGAVYQGAKAEAVNQAWVDRHYAAGTAPWSGDLGGVRLGRVLDLAEVPSTLRELDPGITTLQSAEIASQTVLEHSQKVGETEFGLLFVTRDGKVRLVGRTALFGREPGPAVYGDETGDVGYREFVPDDGDEVVRNIARISRLNGVLQTATDTASTDEFGPFTYTLDGLLHQSDGYSLDYANLVVEEYGIQQRRIQSLTVGPPISGQEATVYPAMLGPELGDAINFKSNPIGGGAEFTQVCAIEGIQAHGEPGGVRQTVFTLSPEFAIRELEDIDVATLGYAQVTANQGSITTGSDLTGLTTTVTVGSGRRVKITAHAGFTNTAADDQTNMRTQEGATVLQECPNRLPVASGTGTFHSEVILTPSAGSHTYKLQASRDTGTGTVTMTASTTDPAFILVEDVGPV